MINNVLCVADVLDEPVPRCFLDVLRYHLDLWKARLYVFYADPDEIVLPCRIGNLASDDAAEIAEKHGIPYIDLSCMLLEPFFTDFWGERFMRAYRVLPVFFVATVCMLPQ